MKTGFVILNYNSWEMTAALAQKAISYQNIDAVIVVDNCSPDDSWEHLMKMSHEKLHVVQSGRNGGYSWGNNCGARICEQLGMEIVFFSNPDVSVEELHVQKIREQFLKAGYSLLSGVEYGIDGEMTQPPIWKRRGYWDDWRDCFFLWRKFGRECLGAELDRSVQVQEAEMAKGAFFAVRLEDFKKAGGFDERVFLYCEERILSKRLENLGKKVGIVTDAKYTHTQNASIQREYKRRSDRIQMLYRARLHYQREYNKVRGMKYRFLWGAMKISVLEYKIWDFIFHFLL